MKQPTHTASHNKIVELLKENGITDLHGGVQLFANQYDKEWSVSVNFSGTGLHIDREEIDTHELADDELIKVCKTWYFKDEQV